MPNTNEPVAKDAMEHIEAFAGLNKKFHGEPTFRISIGFSTGEKGSDLESIMRAADDNMYREKRVRHQQADTKN